MDNLKQMLKTSQNQKYPFSFNNIFFSQSLKPGAYITHNAI